MAESTVNTRFEGLSDCFVLKDAIILPEGTVINHGTTKSGTVTVNNAGYYPLGVRSYWIINSTTGGQNNSVMLLSKLYLSSRASGTCNVTYYLRNIHASGNSNVKMQVKVLWVKE